MRARTTSGFSLIELAVAMTLMGIVTGGIFMVVDSTGRAVRTGVTGGELDNLGRRTVDRVAELLMQSRRGSVLPAAPAAVRPTSTPQVVFPRVTGFNGTNAIWGNNERINFQYEAGELDDGLDNNGNGLIDEGRVVWTTNLGLPNQRAVTLCKWVGEFLDGEVFEGFVDENGNGLVDERGLCFEFDGDRVTIRLTLQRTDGNGAVIARTFVRTVAFRQG